MKTKEGKSPQTDSYALTISFIKGSPNVVVRVPTACGFWIEFETHPRNLGSLVVKFMDSAPANNVVFAEAELGVFPKSGGTKLCFVYDPDPVDLSQHSVAANESNYKRWFSGFLKIGALLGGLFKAFGG